MPVRFSVLVSYPNHVAVSKTVTGFLRFVGDKPWLFFLAMVAPGFVWAYLDYHVWPWDQAQYGEVTLRNLSAFDQGIISGIASMDLSMDFRAPGLTWLG